MVSASLIIVNKFCVESGACPVLWTVKAQAAKEVGPGAADTRVVVGVEDVHGTRTAAQVVLRGRQS